MGRPTDFGDKTIKKGFGPDKEKKIHVKAGQPILVRVVTGLEEYLSHSIHDVLPPKRDPKTGANVPSIFNANCGRGWDPKAGEDGKGDYAGPCKFHELDYDVTERYVAGAMALAMIMGKTVVPLDPASCGRFWDMTAGRVAEIRKVIEDKFPEINDPAEVSKKLKQTMFKLDLKDEGGAEMYQKLDIKVWEGQQIPITQAHKDAYLAEIPKILKEVSAPSTPEEQERRLKKRQAQASAPATGQAAGEQQEDNLDDLDLDNPGTAPAAAAPAPQRKQATPRAAAKKPAPAPEPVAEEIPEEPAAEGEESLDDLEAAPAPAPAPKAAPKKTATTAATKTATATAAAGKKTGNPAVDDMLDGLEGIG